ncbi:MAG: DUF4389 domain-containing protein [Mariprofundus sp.]|nr:DUF4389 domain-containing protein [Mariprofundus sp.]
MNEKIKKNLTNCSVWMRLVFMILFAIIGVACRFVLLTVVLVQFCWLLINGSTNQRLLAFGSQMATFVYQILNYLTFNSEQRPFPFSDWPAANVQTAEVTQTEKSEPADATTDILIDDFIVDTEFKSQPEKEIQIETDAKIVPIAESTTQNPTPTSTEAESDTPPEANADRPAKTTAKAKTTEKPLNKPKEKPASKTDTDNSEEKGEEPKKD